MGRNCLHLTGRRPDMVRRSLTRGLCCKSYRKYMLDTGGPAHTARELFLSSPCVSHEKFAEIPETITCMCLNNLGNRMDVAGRAIEALEYWRRALGAGQLRDDTGNRAKTLADYARALEDRGVKTVTIYWTSTRSGLRLPP